MRRSDREITNIEEITDVLNRCQTLRIAIQAEDYPYIVPVSYGYQLKHDRIILYFHCARQGRKAELLAQNPKVCVETDLCHDIRRMHYGITAMYESIIGTGDAQLLEDPSEVKEGLQCLLDHYGYSDFNIEECKSLSNTAVYRIILKEFSGKHHID